MGYEKAIRALEEAFPLEPPKLEDSEREIFMRAGARQAIDLLKTLQEQEDDPIPEPEGGFLDV